MPENTVETIRLLVVTRELDFLGPLWSMGESNSWLVETANSGWEAMERVQSHAVPHLLVLDLAPDAADDLHLLRWLRRLSPGLVILVTCHSDDVNTKNEALRLGAETIQQVRVAIADIVFRKLSARFVEQCAPSRFIHCQQGVE